MWGEQPSLQVVQGHPVSSPRICEGQHPEKGEQEAGVETGYGAFPWAVPPSSGLWAAIAPEVVRVDSSAPPRATAGAEQPCACPPHPGRVPHCGRPTTLGRSVLFCVFQSLITKTWLFGLGDFVEKPQANDYFLLSSHVLPVPCSGFPSTCSHCCRPHPPAGALSRSITV